MNIDIEPSLSDNPRKLTTPDTGLAAYLASHGLEMESWDLSPNGRNVTFEFADPERQGIGLTLKYSDSAECKFLASYRFLTRKVREITRGASDESSPR